MSAVSVQQPFPIFTDADGSPLDSGYIYLGTAGLEPETNPVQAYWDAALTIPATQPIRTLGGYPIRSGSPARLYVNNDCSIKILDKNQTLVDSSFNLTDKFSPAQVAISPVYHVSNMIGLLAQDTTLSPAVLLGFHDSGDKEPLTYVWNPLESKANHNGGTIIDPDNAADLATWDAAAQATWATPGSGIGCWVTGTYTVYVKDFGAKCDGTTSDVVPVNLAKSIDGGFDFDGQLTLDSTVTLDSGKRPFVLGRGTTRQSGSTLPDSSIIWTGGASPMFSQSGSYYTFKGFAVENRGTATCWLDLISGAIGNNYVNLDFVSGSGHTQFSLATINSQGNRMGYSVFRNCQVSSPSNIFINIDGQATSNNITPIFFDERCIFNCTTASTSFTIIKLKDETLESVIFNRCTFNRQASAGDFTIVDTTDTPLTPTINNLVLNDNEIDINPTGSLSTHRLFKLTNVDSIAFNDNKCNLGGQMAAMADLVNSKVTSCNGNYYESIAGPLFSGDAASKVFVGVNYPDTTNTQGVTNNLASMGMDLVTYQAVMVLNPQLYDAGRNTIFRIDVTDGASWQVRVTSTKPYWLAPGQFFTVQVRNVSGGAISAGSFTTGFVTGVPVTAPTNGNHVTYQFYWDGTIAQPVSGVAPTQMSNT